VKGVTSPASTPAVNDSQAARSGASAANPSGSRGSLGPGRG
jgi:hypothetical protein